MHSVHSSRVTALAVPLKWKIRYVMIHVLYMRIIVIHISYTDFVTLLLSSIVYYLFNAHVQYYKYLGMNSNNLYKRENLASISSNFSAYTGCLRKTSFLYYNYAYSSFFLSFFLLTVKLPLSHQDHRFKRKKTLIFYR